jgi:hypothetical protein
VTDKGASRLAAITSLKVLDLYHTLVTEAGYRQLHTIAPAVQRVLGKGIRAADEASLMNRRQFAKLLPWPALAAPAPVPAWISRLGGTGDGVAVKLSGTWVNDSELLDLAAMPGLERLDLSHTRISDEGLLLLRPAKRIRELNLLYAEQITDQGMNAIKQWRRSCGALNVRGTRIGDGTMTVASGLPADRNARCDGDGDHREWARQPDSARQTQATRDGTEPVARGFAGDAAVADRPRVAGSERPDAR